MLLAFGRAKALVNSRAGGFSLDHLKGICIYFEYSSYFYVIAIARHIGLPVSQNKAEVLDSIFKRKVEDQVLDIVLEPSKPANYRKNKHTFPRLANFIFQYPDKLAYSRLVSSRSDLQNRENNHLNPIYVEAVRNLNSSMPSGGLIAQHDILIEKQINPEFTQSGQMTTEYAYTLMKEVINNYATAMKHKGQSGTHQHSFWSFCKGNTDVLYLYLWMEHLNHPELERFCEEGCEAPYSFDVGLPPDDLAESHDIQTSESEVIFSSSSLEPYSAVLMSPSSSSSYTQPSSAAIMSSSSSSSTPETKKRKKGTSVALDAYFKESIQVKRESLEIARSIGKNTALENAKQRQFDMVKQLSAEIREEEKVKPPNTEDSQYLKRLKVRRDDEMTAYEAM